MKDQRATPELQYRRLEISAIKKGRRGKHRNRVQGILQELRTLSEGAATEIPLDDAGGIGLANLRSAVHRAATAERLSIETVADEKNLYEWRTENRSGR